MKKFTFLFLSYFVVFTLITTQSIFAKEEQTISKTESSNSKVNKLSKQRLLFQQAETAIEKKQFVLYHDKIKKIRQLGNYPLLSYLRFQYLQARFSKLNNNNIDVFINNNKDTPYAARLRRAWLNYLAKHKHWQEYLEFYPQQAIDTIFNSPEVNQHISRASTKRACYYLNSLLANNQQNKALKLVEKIWLSERSQPKACDKIFKLWQENNGLTSELRWQRIILAINKNNRSLAKYISKPFQGKDKILFSTWQSLYNKPKKIFKSKLLKLKHPYQEQVLSHLIKRLSYRDTDFAQQVLNDKKLLNNLPKFAQTKLRYHTGIILAKRHKPGAYDILDKISNKDSDKYLSEWRVRAAIRVQNWEQIIKAIERLEKTEKQTNRWQYWLAKSYLMQDKEILAKPIFLKLAKKRSYYGFLAADYLKLEYNFGHKPSVIEDNKLKQFAKNETIQRAYEFYSMQRFVDARREWFYLTSNLNNDQEVELSAKIAQSWGWHDRAILTIAQSEQRDDLTLRFPITYHQLVEKYANKNELDKSYVFAFIRRESAFSQQARSPVGAIGLMQVMPRTGKQVARKNNIRFKNKYQLYKPEYNIKIGTKYLQSMMNKYQEQIILASGAYNAGPHRVKKWLPKDKAIAAENWIETIPFKETRNYVSAILMYRAIYQYRLAQPVTRLKEAMNLFDRQQALIFSGNQSHVSEQSLPKIAPGSLAQRI
ncbi:MAG: transglycosylase SLT domain-containing protein [Gammaproteobacteria bacterium]|nr:transglycosylase SLT domain-containing protein [Gammaproteobacteria bacterium]